MPDIAETLRNAAEILRKSGIIEPRREAASLLAFALGKDKTFLIAHGDYELSVEENTKFQSFLSRRASREPFQYITGFQEFYRLDFFVTSDVLIPRPETELIVENAIGILREIEKPRFCEVGTGSGCISVSILHEAKTATAIGLDISPKALEIARRNADANDVSARFELKHSDVFDNLKIEKDEEGEKFDLIVSNPPYVAFDDLADLQPEVRDHEPQIALTDGGKGLSIIEKIIADSPQFLKPNGFLLMEIGYGQAAEVSHMFRPEIWENVEFLPDLQAIQRTVKAQFAD
ncbi:MAG: peptide chain release factor N(5)-glutamine methyltransferase [Pyrinomonadaceae bacterium]